jgi:hypothetical protein
VGRVGQGDREGGGGGGERGDGGQHRDRAGGGLHKNPQQLSNKRECLGDPSTHATSWFEIGPHSTSTPFFATKLLTPVPFHHHHILYRYAMSRDIYVYARVGRIVTVAVLCQTDKKNRMDQMCLLSVGQSSS